MKRRETENPTVLGIGAFWIAVLSPLLISGCKESRSSSPHPLGYAEQGTVAFTMGVRFDVPRGTRKIDLVHILPDHHPGIQDILKLDTSHPITQEWRADGNRYGRFVFTQLKAGRTDFWIRGEAGISRRDLETARRKPMPAALPPHERPAHLKAERYLETTDTGIRRLAAACGRDTTIKTLRSCFDATVSRLEYAGYNPGNVGAAAALKQRSGDCTEYCDLMVSLCRASGIPARAVYGYTVTWISVAKHNWVQVYVDRLGWVSFDPTHADHGNATFERMKNNYLLISTLRNDPEMHDYAYFYYRYEGAAPKASDTFSIRVVD